MIPTEIKFSETDPGQAPLKRAAVELKTGQAYQFPKDKGSREVMIAKVQNCVGLPVELQNILLAGIAAVPAKYEFMSASLFWHPLGDGVNFSGSVQPF